MALISFWLHLVFLVFSCSSVPRVPLFHVFVSEVLVSSRYAAQSKEASKDGSEDRNSR